MFDDDGKLILQLGTSKTDQCFHQSLISKIQNI